MGWWETDQAECDYLEFVLDRMLRPYYGWHFPEGPMRVNIGICYEDRNDRKNARNLFSSFLKRHYPDVLISGRQVGSYKGQPISYSFRTGSLTSLDGSLSARREAWWIQHPARASIKHCVLVS